MFFSAIFSGHEFGKTLKRPLHSDGYYWPHILLLVQKNLILFYEHDVQDPAELPAELFELVAATGCSI